VLDGASPWKRSPIFYFNSPSSHAEHVNPSTSGRQRYREKGGKEERAGRLCKRIPNDWPEWFLVFGVAHTRRPGGTHSRLLRVSCAPGRSGEEGSSRLILAQEDSPRGGYILQRRRSSVFARKAAANVPLAARIRRSKRSGVLFRYELVASLWTSGSREETLTKRITPSQIHDANIHRARGHLTSLGYENI